MITFFFKFIHIILFVILRLYFLNPNHTFCIQITNFIAHTLSPSLYLSYIFYASIMGGLIKETMGRLISKFFIYESIAPQKAKSHHFKNIIISAQQAGNY